MKTPIFTGSAVAIITPFLDQKVNLKKFQELLEFHMENKTDAIVVYGTTGESATLSDSEKSDLLKTAVKTVNGKIPVIAGTGSNCTYHSIELSKQAEQLGADGLLLVTPYYNKATQTGLIKHYESIVESVNLPAILYNVPSRTGVSIKPETLSTLSKHSRINAIKDASGSIAETQKIVQLCGDDIIIYSGNDDLTYSILALGGKGVISVVANIFPQQMHELVTNYLQGNIQKSLEMQLDMLDLIESLFIEVNPIPVKTAMQLMKIDSGELRLPLCEMSDSNKQKLERVIESYIDCSSKK